MLVQALRVKELEEQFALYCKTKYAVAFNSGTAALHSGLYALGINHGDEVITTPFTFVATANVILMLGAKPVFADINEDDFNINPREVAKKFTKKTRAIIPVDLFGQVYDYGRLSMVIENRGIKILEDACQAIGAEHNGKKAGNFGNAAAFSFYATKNITCGEGGVTVTNNKKVMELCKMFRHHGQFEQRRYEYYDIGYNYRMTDIAAAIALAQLKKVKRFNAQRIINAKMLSDGLKNIKGLILPTIHKQNKHVFHQYVVRITKDFKSSREQFMNYLTEKGVGNGVYYPKPLHLVWHLKRLGYKKGDFPIAEQVSQEVLSLPVHPLITKKELQYIISTIKNYAC
jgi:perosamine synthetase